ncbi:MAG: P1 family peptidase [Thermoleophilia bacterium]|nr:P1 family peptidase [Thermoleophilia bacterium]
MAARVAIEGLSVGHFSDYAGVTGCTVILAPQGVTASVDIRGGAPGTLETALLSPYVSVPELQGVLLTGGSALGLGAAAGVSTFLREGGYGYATPYARVPLVSAAVIYDLGLGSAEAFPRPEDAYAAAASAGTLVEEGSIGAGTGATVGKLLGHDGMMKGGIALSTVEVGGGVTVSALTVVNALGDVLDEKGAILAGARRGGEFVGSKETLLSMRGTPAFGAVESTTLSVVMTDARLDKLQCGIVARMSHDGFARAIDPVHTPVDGDCVFVLATGVRDGNVFQLGAGAAEAVSLSIRRAVRQARGLDGAPSVSDLAGEGGSSVGPMNAADIL